MDFCLKNSKMYILIGSADFSVSLSDINGNLFGIFGQEAHWKLEQNLSMRATPSRFASNSLLDLDKSQNVNPADAKDQQSDQEATDESYREQQYNKSDAKDPEVDELAPIPRNFDCLLPKLRDKLRFEETFEFEDDAFIRDTSLRYNPWSKTILGESFSLVSLTFFMKWASKVSEFQAKFTRNHGPRNVIESNPVLSSPKSSPTGKRLVKWPEGSTAPWRRLNSRSSKTISRSPI